MMPDERTAIDFSERLLGNTHTLSHTLVDNNTSMIRNLHKSRFFSSLKISSVITLYYSNNLKDIFLCFFLDNGIYVIGFTYPVVPKGEFLSFVLFGGTGAIVHCLL